MKPVWRLLLLMRPVMGWMILGGLLSFATLIANVTLMATSGWFIAAMALAGVHGITMNYFTPAAIIRFSAIVRTMGRYAERLVTHSATLHILSQLRVWFYQQIEPLAPAGLESFRSGDLLSRIRADIDTLDQFYLRLLLPVAVALTSTLVFLLFLALFDPLLVIIEATLLIIAGVVLPLLSNRLSSFSSQRINQLNSKLRMQLVDDLQGMGELLVDGADKRHTLYLAELSEELSLHQKRISQINGLSQGMVGLCANLAMWLILIYAIPMVQQAELPPAQLAMLALFTLASFEAVAPLPLAFQSLGEQLAAARRIFNLVDRQPMVQEPIQEMPLTTDLTLNLFKVSYHYPQHQAGIDDISLLLSPGKKIALLGASGCGKSTLVQLLLKFRSPDKGRLSLGGIRYEQLSGETVRSHISVSAQQTHLFNTTIRNNLLLAQPDADLQQLKAVCQLAMIHDFIEAQPEGYETMVGELGVRLSLGQARRLTVARALLKPAPLLILDEPTEGLDNLTAQQMRDNIIQQCPERGILWITHNLSGLEAMDEILIMQKGHIVERGKPADLVTKGGLYLQMQDHQRSLSLIQKP
ncbi:MAG: thiol reductant ABC exporter subunit CydC [Candidatus Thiodiazotropha sp. 6PLUC2]